MLKNSCKHPIPYGDPNFNNKGGNDVLNYEVRKNVLDVSCSQ